MASTSALQSNPDVEPSNWIQCIFCQKSQDEALVCPAESRRQDVGAGYRTLEHDLTQFDQLGELPRSLNISRLDEGDGIGNTLFRRQAKWHKSCRDIYNKTKLYRLMKRKVGSGESTHCAVLKRSRSSTDSTREDPTCIFCDETDKAGKLHNASTFGLDSRIRSAAVQVGDTALLAKLSAGDVVAIEMSYHLKCLTSLYNRARAMERKQSPEELRKNVMQSIGFAELVAYIEDELNCNDNPMLKLADVVKMYSNRMNQLGNKGEKIHSTRLKEKLLVHVPGLQAFTKGKDVLLIRDSDVADVLSNVFDRCSDSDAICLAKAATIVRRNMFDDSYVFQGSFTSNCQDSSVPTELTALIRMILEGPNISKQTENAARPEALAISQLIRHNSIKYQRRRPSSTTVRHTRNQETPLPLYLGMMIHAHTRKRGIIDKLFEFGLCVSYDRVLQLSTDLANAVCEAYGNNKVVVPTYFRTGVFTTSAVDNIDHNPSSTTATGSFHGTGISLFQHQNEDGEGTPLDIMTLSSSPTKSVNQLPDFYTHVPPIVTPSRLPPVPDALLIPLAEDHTLEPSLQEEYLWLDNARNASLGLLEDCQFTSWSAYHASHHSDTLLPKGNSALLPLFQDTAHSVAMIRHSMSIIMNAVKYLNPGQVPVLACDQPLYAISKHIQWKWADTFGEDKLVMIFGGLHIEMAAWKAIGTFVDGSGWTDVLVQADVATSGKADSYLQATHLMRTRYAHEITAASLYILKHKAYDDHILELDNTADKPTIDEWCSEQIQKHLQFKYWSLILELELMVLTFVRSLRSSDFHLYVDILVQLMPWFFALNRTNYSRWLSIHIRDMQELPLKHPLIAREFEAGKFTFQKTGRTFSAMPLDQAHEQNNEMVKGDGGAIGLTENPQALRRWMIGGPHIARLVHEFEECTHTAKEEESKHHHQVHSHQTNFKTHVQSMVDTVVELGNPFSDDSKELLCLSTKDVFDVSVVNTVNEIKDIGLQQYQTFITERLIHRSKPIDDPIPQNKLALMKDRPRTTGLSKPKLLLKSSKNDCFLFSRLYIGCQNRGGNLDDFFCHENQACPPSISDGGKLRHGTKSDLLQCLEQLCDGDAAEPDVSAVILDGAAVVQMLKPGTTKTFQEYSANVFLPHITRWLEKVNRVDVVWDVYLESSLKASTRERRGKGSRRKVLPSSPIPKNWQDFLRVDGNKTELFQMLSQDVVHIKAGDKEIIATHGQEVMCVPEREAQDLAQMAPCSHEEADTRMIVHCVDAANKGHRRILIRTVDTDVVVLAVAACQFLPLDELWIAFGSGKTFRYIAAHQYAAALGPAKARALPIFHALTGCDTVSSFSGRGKKTAWDVWMSFDSLTDVLVQLAVSPGDTSADQLAVLERFVVLLYERTSGLSKVNDSRKHLFTKKGRSIEAIPPTYAALIQHIRRAIYQGAHIWGQCLVPQPVLPNPTFWGWTLEENTYRPLWTTLPEAAKMCQELVHCGCLKGCSGRCNCVKAELQCTALCACDGQCIRD